MLVRPPHHAFHGSSRDADLLMGVAALLELLDTEEEECDFSVFRGRYLGAKCIKRTRSTVERMFHQLGSHAVKAYKSSLEMFNFLHSIMEPYIIEQFGDSKRGRPNGLIPTRLRLSCAIRYFCGTSVYDLMLTHGISKPSVYKSIYGVINAANNCPELALNEGGAEFPSHGEQRQIAAEFLQMSSAFFNCCCLTLDGMLVWTNQPTKQDCLDVGIGERSFHCYRKDKFGMLLLAGSDARCRFKWADITHPGCASDFTAWVASELGMKLAQPGQDIIAPGLTIFGDNAFVETQYMSTPIPGKKLSRYDDAYNFYFSQLRITVERAFGILVHHWAHHSISPIERCIHQNTCGK